MGTCCYREVHSSASKHGIDQKADATQPATDPQASSRKQESHRRSKSDFMVPQRTHTKGLKQLATMTTIRQRKETFKSKRMLSEIQPFPITTKRLKKPFSQKFKQVHVDHKAALGKFLLVRGRNDGLYYLVKKVQRSADPLTSGQHQETQLRTEIGVGLGLDHPNILQYRQVLFDEQSIYAVTEPAVSSQFLLAEEIAAMRVERLAADVVTQVLEAVAYSHSLGVTHGNLGPHNLLFIACDKESILVKITGFGVSYVEKYVNDPRNANMYSAPEAFAHEIQPKTDVWSCGVLLYYLLCANLPFRAESFKRMAELVGNYPPQFTQQFWGKATPGSKELLVAMLKSDLEQRLSASDCLAHSWLQQHSASATSATKSLSMALAHLKSFSGGLRLKFVVLAFVAAHVTTAEQKQELIEVFRSIDFDHDGVLNVTDLTKAYSLIVHQTIAELIAKRVIERVDLDSDGSIDFSEFMVAASDHRSLLTDENLKVAFEMFDIDKSEGVSLVEMKETLKCHESEEHWNELMAEADENADGTVSFKEFAALVRRAAGEDKANKGRKGSV